MSNDAGDLSLDDMQSRLVQLRQAMQQEDPTPAIYACDRFNRDYPLSPHGWNIASHLALRINDPDAALRAVERAIELAPERNDWQLQRAHCLSQCGRKGDARALALTLSQRLYPTAEISSAVGLLLSGLGLQQEALPLFEEAVKQQPETGGHYYNLATVQRFLGDLDAAEKNLDTAITLDPEDTESIALRSGLRKQSAEHNHVNELKASLLQLEDKPRRKVAVCHALAKELEDLGAYAESFAALKDGADTRRRHITYNVQADVDTMTQIRHEFDGKRMSRGDEGHIDARPIFVVGMPRTGTTLVERILGSHSSVYAAGELSTFAVQLTNILRSGEGAAIRKRPQLVSASARLDTAMLGRAYVEHCPLPKALHQGALAAWVDKMPMNFLYAGLIHLALPKAKIIHLRRQPLDTCYAVYKTLFQNAYPYSYTLEELARYYVAYARLMQHWDEMIPGVIHHVSYESLTGEPETVIREILKYCDLSFEEGCLNFHENNSASMTASAAQVRRPMYQDSLGLYKHYEKELQPAISILQAAGIT